MPTAWHAPTASALKCALWVRRRRRPVSTTCPVVFTYTPKFLELYDVSNRCVFKIADTIQDFDSLTAQIRHLLPRDGVRYGLGIDGENGRVMDRYKLHRLSLEFRSMCMAMTMPPICSRSRRTVRRNRSPTPQPMPSPPAAMMPMAARRCSVGIRMSGTGLICTHNAQVGHP